MERKYSLIESQCSIKRGVILIIDFFSMNGRPMCPAPISYITIFNPAPLYDEPTGNTSK